ncbi:hypothetical protein VIGAN_UM014400, partial [Vigna angularis var. angularis]
SKFVYVHFVHTNKFPLFKFSVFMGYVALFYPIVSAIPSIEGRLTSGFQPIYPLSLLRQCVLRFLVNKKENRRRGK